MLSRFSRNVGNVDRAIRLGIAVLLLYLGLGVYAGSTLGIILAIVALIPLATALVGTCPLYTLLGVNTCQLRRRS